MITIKQKKEFCRVVGYRWVARVLAHLALKKIVNKQGKPYSYASLNAILNGKFHNEAIEKAFFEVCQEVKKEHAKMREF